MSELEKTRNLYIRDAEWAGMKKEAHKRRVSLAQLVREMFDRFLGIPTVAAQIGPTRLYPATQPVSARIASESRSERSLEKITISMSLPFGWTVTDTEAAVIGIAVVNGSDLRFITLSHNKQLSLSRSSDISEESDESVAFDIAVAREANGG